MVEGFIATIVAQQMEIGWYHCEHPYRYQRRAAGKTGWPVAMTTRWSREP